MSFSFSANHINQHQNTQNQPQQQQNRQSSPQSPQPQLQRRESLVKPTWHNVSPGQVPHDTLDKLNKLSNGEQHQILQQYTTHYETTANGGCGLGASIESSTTIGRSTVDVGGNVVNTTGTNNNNQIVSKVMGKQRRQVELFDLFGKVCVYMWLRVCSERMKLFVRFYLLIWPLVLSFSIVPFADIGNCIPFWNTNNGKASNKRDSL